LKDLSSSSFHRRLAVPFGASTWVVVQGGGAEKVKGSGGARSREEEAKSISFVKDFAASQLLASPAAPAAAEATLKVVYNHLLTLPSPIFLIQGEILIP
jgi:hypothetical protein